MSGIIRYFVVGALLVFAAEPKCPNLKGLDDQSVAKFTLEHSTKLSTDFMTGTIKSPKEYIAANQEGFNAFVQTYMTETIKSPQAYIAANQEGFNAFAQTYMIETIKSPQEYIAANQEGFNTFTQTYMTETIKSPQAYIAANQEGFNAFTQTYIAANQVEFSTFTQTYMTAHQEDYGAFKSPQHDNFVADFKANNEGASDEDAEQAFEASMLQAFTEQVVATAFIGQVVATAYIGQVIATAYIGQVIATEYIGQVIATAFITKTVTEAITPKLTAEIKEYVQGNVEECLITKGCGAFIVQGVSPNPPIPTFKGTSCTRCTDVISEEVCKNSTTHTCVWSGGTCSQSNCPTLMNDQFVAWRKSGLTKDQYLEENHAKENKAFTKKLCDNYGCMYMNSFYWCSAWAKWALIVTLVVSILFVIAVVVGIVVFCVYKKKNKSLGQTESTAELEHNSSEKKIEESNTQ